MQYTATIAGIEDSLIFGKMKDSVIKIYNPVLDF